MQGRCVPSGGLRKVCIVLKLPFRKERYPGGLSKPFKTSSNKRSLGQGSRWLHAAVVGCSEFEGESEERLQLT